MCAWLSWCRHPGWNFDVSRILSSLRMSFPTPRSICGCFADSRRSLCPPRISLVQKVKCHLTGPAKLSRMILPLRRAHKGANPSRSIKMSCIAAPLGALLSCLVRGAQRHNLGYPTPLLCARMTARIYVESASPGRP